MVSEVAVVFPTCDRNPTKSLQSILNQTFKNFQIIICNDGNEKVYDLAKSLFDLNKFGNYLVISPGIKYQGASATRNKCIEAGCGEIICYLDDDDYYSPDHLETVIDFFRNNPDKDFVSTKAWGIKERDCKSIRAEIWVKDLPDGRVKGFLPAPYYQPEMMNETNVAPILCMAHRRKCIDVGLFDEKIPILNDWEYFQRMSLKYELYHINKFTGFYSIHGKGVVSKNKEKVLIIEKIIKQRRVVKLVSEIWGL